MLPEPRLARQIVETLGQSGTPLSKGVSYYPDYAPDVMIGELKAGLKV